MRGLQWTKLGYGATLHCNVDRRNGGGLIGSHLLQTDISHSSE
jgi:hypothetical protein